MTLSLSPEIQVPRFTAEKLKVFTPALPFCSVANEEIVCCAPEEFTLATAAETSIAVFPTDTFTSTV